MSSGFERAITMVVGLIIYMQVITVNGYVYNFLYWFIYFNYDCELCTCSKIAVWRKGFSLRVWFDPYGTPRSLFDIHFYLISILFIIFD